MGNILGSLQIFVSLFRKLIKLNGCLIKYYLRVVLQMTLLRDKRIFCFSLPLDCAFFCIKKPTYDAESGNRTRATLVRRVLSPLRHPSSPLGSTDVSPLWSVEYTLLLKCCYLKGINREG